MTAREGGNQERDLVGMKGGDGKGQQEDVGVMAALASGRAVGGEGPGFHYDHGRGNGNGGHSRSLRLEQ